MPRGCIGWPRSGIQAEPRHGLPHAQDAEVRRPGGRTGPHALRRRPALLRDRLKQEHAHVICLRCGKVEEFYGEPLQRLRRQIESHFRLSGAAGRTEVGGYCAHCQTLRAREVESCERLAEPVEPPAKPAPGALRPRRAAGVPSEPEWNRLPLPLRFPLPPCGRLAGGDRPQRPPLARAHRTAAHADRAASREPRHHTDSRVSREQARIVAENGTTSSRIAAAATEPT